MNAFLVIIGSIIVGLLIALWAVKKFQIKTKVFGIPLQYVLDTALLLAAIILVIVVKTALGSKSKAIEQLLIKLRIMKSQNDINIVNDHIQENNDSISALNKQIAALQGSSDQAQIDALLRQKNEIEQELYDLNTQKQGHTDNKTSLEDRVAQMQKKLNG